ncbi:hypothetical protein LTR95_000497 [Oleoguttula sp. CCFEE 5521]
MVTKAGDSGLLGQSRSSACTIIIGHGEEDVGKTRLFTVHEKVIRRRSKFFEAALSKSWIENEKHTVKLPERDPDVVRQYLHQPYVGTLYEGTTPWTHSRSMNTDVHPNLAQLYVFGEYVQDKSFRLSVLSAIIKLLCEPCADGTSYYPSKETLQIIYGGTPVESPERQILVACYAGAGEAEWLTDCRGADAFPNEFLLDLACVLYKSPEERLSFDEAHVKEITEFYTALEQ